MGPLSVPLLTSIHTGFRDTFGEMIVDIGITIEVRVGVPFILASSLTYVPTFVQGRCDEELPEQVPSIDMVKHLWLSLLLLGAGIL